MAMMTGRKRAVRETPWSRAIPKRASVQLQKVPLATGSRPGYRRRSGGMQVRGGHMLGAPGGARAAHIMQFRPVRVERPGEELAPEGPYFSEWAGPPVAAVRPGGKGF